MARRSTRNVCSALTISPRFARSHASTCISAGSNPDSRLGTNAKLAPISKETSCGPRVCPGIDDGVRGLVPSWTSTGFVAWQINPGVLSMSTSHDLLGACPERHHDFLWIYWTSRLTFSAATTETDATPQFLSL